MRIVPFAFVAALVYSGVAVSAAVASDHQSAEMVGALCVPDSRTIREGNYETLGFGVHFARGRVGNIRLICPFHNGGDVSTIAAMDMSVIDSDGMGIGGRVRTHLRRARQGRNVGELLGTCNSNTSIKTGPQYMFCNIRDIGTTGQYSYWVEVLMDRSNPNVEVEFLGTAIRRD